MDALTHNVESYLSPAYHPLCDGIALEGARIAARALGDRGARSRGDIAARGDMMMSSMMGAIAFQKDLGAVHSCAHALGTVVRPAPRPGQRADDRHRASPGTSRAAPGSSRSWRTSSAASGGAEAFVAG